MLFRRNISNLLALCDFSFFENETKVAIAGGSDIQILDLYEKEILKTLIISKREWTEALWAIKFIKDEKKLISTGLDRLVCVWDVESGKCEKELKLDSQIWSVEVTEDERFMLLGKSEVMKVEIESFKIVETKKRK